MDRGAKKISGRTTPRPFYNCECLGRASQANGKREVSDINVAHRRHNRAFSIWTRRIDQQAIEHIGGLFIQSVSCLWLALTIFNLRQSRQITRQKEPISDFAACRNTLL